MKNYVIFNYGFCFYMDYNKVSFYVESCQLLFANKLSWIFYEQIDFFDNLYIIMKLITVFICYEYKPVIKQ